MNTIEESGPVPVALRRCGLTKERVTELVAGYVKPKRRFGRPPNPITADDLPRDGSDYRHYSAADLAKIRNLLAAGRNQNQIAKELGIPRGTMTYLMGKHAGGKNA